MGAVKPGDSWSRPNFQWTREAGLESLEMTTFLLGALALSLQLSADVPAGSPGAGSSTVVYRYTDSSGQEHFVNDPEFAPPEVRSTLKRVNLLHSPTSEVHLAPVAAGSFDAGVEEAIQAIAAAPEHGSGHWIWASLIAGLVFVLFLVGHATVPSGYARVSWALSVGRYASFMLLLATLLAASYELRDDPTLRRYSPWAALEGLQRTRSEALQHSMAPAAGPSERHAR
jgi:hypothetical protein